MLAFISFGKIKKIYSIKEKMPYLIRIYSFPCFKRTDIWYKTVQLYDLTFFRLLQHSCSRYTTDIEICVEGCKYHLHLPKVNQVVQSNKLTINISKYSNLFWRHTRVRPLVWRHGYFHYAGFKIMTLSLPWLIFHFLQDQETKYILKRR